MNLTTLSTLWQDWQGIIVPVVLVLLSLLGLGLAQTVKLSWRGLKGVARVFKARPRPVLPPPALPAPSALLDAFLLTLARTDGWVVSVKQDGQDKKQYLTLEKGTVCLWFSEEGCEVHLTGFNIGDSEMDGLLALPEHERDQLRKAAVELYRAVCIRTLFPNLPGALGGEPGALGGEPVVAAYCRRQVEGLPVSGAYTTGNSNQGMPAPAPPAPMMATLRGPDGRARTVVVPNG